MATSKIQRRVFGSIVAPDGQQHRVHQFLIRAETALGPMTVSVLEYGATLQSVVVPDAAGEPIDLVLGFDDLAGYQQGQAYFGATAGRYANRIPEGRLNLAGKEYALSINEGHNHLHGGVHGFDRQHWAGEPTPDGTGVVFRLRSPDGDMGFSGNLDCAVTYRLVPSGGLRIDLEATTDKTTVCNLVNHAYWNLNGHASGSILDQVARFYAPFYTPVDSALLATGEIRSVAETPFDFQHGKRFGEDIAQLGKSGYDHNLVLGSPGSDGWRDCADVFSTRNGLGLRLHTTEPGVQLYTGGGLDESVTGKGGQPYCPYAGFTLETQKFPGSPGFAHFPSCTLQTGEHYDHGMHFQFYHHNL